MAGFFNPMAFEKGNAGVAKRITQCGKCGLTSQCCSPKMEPAGRGACRVLFVGGAPGEAEDRQGVPFVGDGGRLLRNAVEELGFNLDDCWSTYALTCRPPKGKIEPYMVSCCHPSLLKTIARLKPQVIITLGDDALESMLKGVWVRDVGPGSRWVGWNIPLVDHNAWLCPTYDTAQLLRQENDPILALTFKEHLKKALALAETPLTPVLLSDLESQVEIIRSTKEARARLEELATKSGMLAWDYETTGLKPDRAEQRIVSVSFCLNGEETFAFLMKSSLKEALTAVLRNKRLLKVASNLKFEERWTRAKLGHGVAGWHWDTMLAAHCLDNRPGISSVKFLAFVLLGIADYDSHIAPYLKAQTANGRNQIEDVDPDDLLLYNGLDSLLEYLVMERQKETLEHHQ